MQSLTDRSKGKQICMHDRETEIGEADGERGKFNDITVGFVHVLKVDVSVY